MIEVVFAGSKITAGLAVVAANLKTPAPAPEIPQNLVPTPESILFAGGKIGAGLAAVTAAGWTEAKLAYMVRAKPEPYTINPRL